MVRALADVVGTEIFAATSAARLAAAQQDVVLSRIPFAGARDAYTQVATDSGRKSSAPDAAALAFLAAQKRGAGSPSQFVGLQSSAATRTPGTNGPAPIQLITFDDGGLVPEEVAFVSNRLAAMETVATWIPWRTVQLRSLLHSLIQYLETKVKAAPDLTTGQRWQATVSIVEEYVKDHEVDFGWTPAARPYLARLKALRELPVEEIGGYQMASYFYLIGDRFGATPLSLEPATPHTIVKDRLERIRELPRWAGDWTLELPGFIRRKIGNWRQNNIREAFLALIREIERGAKVAKDFDTGRLWLDRLPEVQRISRNGTLISREEVLARIGEVSNIPRDDISAYDVDARGMLRRRPSQESRAAPVPA